MNYDKTQPKSVANTRNGYSIKAVTTVDSLQEQPKYPQISKSWRAHRENLNTLFRYLPDIQLSRFEAGELVPGQVVKASEVPWMLQARYAAD
ncbi:hypothetical protein GA0061070_104131 [Kosakonia oryziphila]|jgi:hypothetical protein|uniref:Uncharacterized protein n=1 Tax=Kosakonia oryziphila TaxID=1005667 RepID=A0A1C4FRS9_9ENTR|nr:hypothetical protein GA0061070_104131 [Kosakonia oryziphila]